MPGDAGLETTYAEQWRAAYPHVDIDRTIELARVVDLVFQAITFDDIVNTTEPESRWELGGVVADILRTLVDPRSGHGAVGVAPSMAAPMAATGPAGTSLTRSDSASEDRNAERDARASSASTTASRNGSPASATPPPSTISSGSTPRASSVTACASPSAKVLPDPGRARVAGEDGRVQGQGARGFVGRPREGERRARRDGLQAAALAAAAHQSGRVDRDVADLPGDTAGAATQPTVDDDAGGETGADAEVGQVARAGEGCDAEGGSVDVVLDQDPSPDRLAEQRDQGEGRAVDAEVDGVGDLAAHRDPRLRARPRRPPRRGPTDPASSATTRAAVRSTPSFPASVAWRTCATTVPSPPRATPSVLVAPMSMPITVAILVHAAALPPRRTTAGNRRG